MEEARLAAMDIAKRFRVPRSTSLEHVHNFESVYSSFLVLELSENNTANYVLDQSSIIYPCDLILKVILF